MDLAIPIRKGDDVWWGELGFVGHPLLVISPFFIACGMAAENTWLSFIWARPLHQISKKVVSAAKISGQEMTSWKKNKRERSLCFENSQGELHLDLRFARVNLHIGKTFLYKSLKLIITTKVTSSALIFWPWKKPRLWRVEWILQRNTTGKAELRLNLGPLTPNTFSPFAVTFC